MELAKKVSVSEKKNKRYSFDRRSRRRYRWQQRGEELDEDQKIKLKGLHYHKEHADRIYHIHQRETKMRPKRLKPTYLTKYEKDKNAKRMKNTTPRKKVTVHIKFDGSFKDPESIQREIIIRRTVLIEKDGEKWSHTLIKAKTNNKANWKAIKKEGDITHSGDRYKIRTIKTQDSWKAIHFKTSAIKS